MIASTLRRKLFEPLYFARSGSPRLRYCRNLEQTQFLSRQQLEAIQWQNLKKLWDILWDNNQYYRQRFLMAGIKKQDLNSVEDIRRLPILTKKEIRNQGMAMLSDEYNLDTLLHFKTGGSTGKALDIYITEECSELRNACARRHDQWTGWQPGECIGAAWGNPKLPKTTSEKIINRFVQPHIYLDTMALEEQSVREFAQQWQKNKATLLFGHAHSLFVLAQYVDKLYIKSIRPKGILSTSMMLLSHERKKIETVFNQKVTDRYGCEEVSLIGSECEEHDGMHMNIEHLVIEFIKDDGSPADPGEPGKIIVTDLMNYAMPFVRYQVEDVGTPLARTCNCGRGLPMMGSVAGRVADFLVKKDGTKVAGISLIENTLTDIPGIDQMQIIQHSLAHISLKVVPGKNCKPYHKNKLIEYFHKTFGHDITIELQEVKEIPPEKSGKYRFSICNV